VACWIFSSFVVVVPALTPVLLLKELRLDGSSLGLVFASLGGGSIIGAMFVMPWLRSRLSSDVLIMISQIALAGGAWRNYLGIQRPDRGYAANLVGGCLSFFRCYSRVAATLQTFAGVIAC
jgi:Transmembrane secretion effector